MSHLWNLNKFIDLSFCYRMQKNGCQWSLHVLQEPSMFDPAQAPGTIFYERATVFRGAARFVLAGESP